MFFNSETTERVFIQKLGTQNCLMNFSGEMISFRTSVVSLHATFSAFDIFVKTNSDVTINFQIVRNLVHLKTKCFVAESDIFWLMNGWWIKLHVYQIRQASLAHNIETKNILNKLKILYSIWIFFSFKYQVTNLVDFSWSVIIFAERYF